MKNLPDLLKGQVQRPEHIDHGNGNVQKLLIRFEFVRHPLASPNGFSQKA
nr:MAG TPA: hypothetical protein [Caudoviricetes sp.]